MQTGGVYLGLPIVHYAPLLLPYEDSLYLLARLHIKYFDCLHDLILKSQESVLVTIFLNNPLEAVHDLDKIEIHPLFVHAYRIFGCLKQIVLGY